MGGNRGQARAAWEAELRQSVWKSRRFEEAEVGEGVGGGLAAHLFGRSEASAYSGAVGVAEYGASVVVGELDTADASGFPVGHAGNRGTDRQGNTAGSTSGTAIHLRSIAGQRGSASANGERMGANFFRFSCLALAISGLDAFMFFFRSVGRQPVLAYCSSDGKGSETVAVAEEQYCSP